MSNLTTFETELDQFEAQVAIEHSNACARAAILLFALIVSRTPVDTGRARSSWQISIGTKNPAVNVEGSYPQYENDAAAYALAVAEATKKLAGYKFGLFGFKPAIWITNRLNYVVFLERGTRKIKATHMVALSVEEVRARFSEIASEASKSGKGGAVGVAVS